MDSIEITLMIVVGAAFCYWIIEMTGDDND